MGQLLTFFSPRSFLQGLGVVAFLYCAVMLYVVLQRGGTLEAMEEKLASETVAISRPVPVIEVVPVSHEDTDVGVDSGYSTEGESPSASALMKAPIEGLYEKVPALGAQAILPVISKNRQLPFHMYKRPFALANRPHIALVFKDFGLMENLSQQAVDDFPADVTFVLSPYADGLDDWQTKARMAGHETWIEVPAETVDFQTNDPGPQALLKTQGVQYNQKRLRWALSRAHGYAGVAVGLDETFTQVKPVIEPVLHDVFKRGLGLLQMDSKAPDLFRKMTREESGIYVENQMAGTENIFQNLELAAETRGHVVAVISLNDIRLDEFSAWIATLESKNISLAPVSALVQK